MGKHVFVLKAGIADGFISKSGSAWLFQCEFAMTAVQCDIVGHIFVQLFLDNIIFDGTFGQKKLDKKCSIFHGS